MNRRRATLTTLAAVLPATFATLAGFGTAAHAQGDKTVRILVGFPPGGSINIVARLLADKMKDDLKTNVIVENRAGAGGRIAAELLKSAPADGSTLMTTPVVVPVLAPLVFSKFNYNAATDFAPVGHVCNFGFAPTVPTALPVKNVAELVTWLKANPHKANFGAPAGVAIELESADGTPLPPFDAGAHVDVRVTVELLRQYSLSNDPQTQGRYRFGVLLDPQSRGGSATVHAAFRVGEVVEIGRPRNNFPLHMDAAHTVLFAGGIGITLILTMTHALHAADSSFELHYCGRSALRLAFLDELQRFGKRLQLHLDDGPASQQLQIDTVLAAPAADRHLYVCGPNGFMDFITQAAQRLGWSDDAVHLERFGAEVNTDGAPFTVVAARSQVSFEVQPGERIADKMIENGIDVRMSCQSGVCGACVTRVIDGVPDHRDHVQTASEKASNRTITVCCSRSKTRRLVLDI